MQFRSTRTALRRSLLAAFLVLWSLAGLWPAVPSRTQAAGAGNFKGDVVYQVMVDRFFDGDPGNNDPAVSPGLYDSSRTEWKLYWGGDLAGLTEKIPYLRDMGITAIWVSPVNDNLNELIEANGRRIAGYHGYWTRDFKAIEEHFGDWSTFDHFVATAHANGIKVIVDFVPNHSNPFREADPDFAEGGALYDSGTYLGNYFDDGARGYFHHNGDILNWDDRWEAQFKNFTDPDGFSLADISHQHPTMDAYLRAAADLFLQHGVDGFRIDAVKHFASGWQKALADHLYAQRGLFLVGEWYGDEAGTANHTEKVRYANQSGIGILDFDLNRAVRDVFAGSDSMRRLWDTLQQTEEYTYKENLVTFIDNHDMPRFLSLHNSQSRLHQALAFILTSRGTPSIYYGTEQYLHNDTNGGGDPYNRPMMSSFRTDTTAYQLIRSLGQLRQANPAVGAGITRERWLNDDVFIYERQFYDDVVLVAINKGSAAVTVSGLLTNLPAGEYADYLGGLLGGGAISVGSGSADRPVAAFTLAAGAVSVWQYQTGASSPQIASVAPVLARSGNSITIDGEGFGTSGTVLFGSTPAAVQSWSPNQIEVTVPSVGAGWVPVQVQTAAGTSNPYTVQVLSGNQASVVFKVRNAPPTEWGETVYVTGNIFELGNWSTDPAERITGLWAPEYPDWYGIYSVPACTPIEFKFFIRRNDGSITWEGGSNHAVTTPCGETGDIVVDWQY